MEQNNVVDKRDGSKKRHHLIKKVNVVILIFGVVLGLSLLASPSLADQTTTIYGTPWGTYRTVWKTQATGDTKIACLGGGAMCFKCGECHTSEPQSEILKKLTQASWDKHIGVYFPDQTYSLSEGAKISWGEGYYLEQRIRLVLYAKGSRRVWTAPPGSRILKDKRGKPFAVLLSGEPIR
jgi:hypothetical protein